MSDPITSDSSTEQPVLSAKRFSFSLRDLLVLVALIALGTTFLMPWIQSAILDAQKNRSRSHGKQLGLAFQNYSDTTKGQRFPALYFTRDTTADRQNWLNPRDAADHYPWTVKLLPFMEEEPLYKEIRQASQGFTLPAQQVRISDPNDHTRQISPGEVTVTSPFQSPLVKGMRKPGNLNYVVLSSTRQPLLTGGTKQGTWSRVGAPDGVVIPYRENQDAPLARIADGTSKTFLFCESAELERSNWFQAQQTFVCGFLPQDSQVADRCTPYLTYQIPSVWVPGLNGDRTALGYGPTWSDPDRRYNTDQADMLRRSWGPSNSIVNGIVVHGLCDGSVQEINYDIEPRVYFSIITARGAENSPYW
jgi:hypothetical protein